MFNSAAYLGMPWVYLLNALIAVALGALLFAGRASLRRAAGLVAVAAVIALVASAGLIAFSYHLPASRAEPGYVATIVAYGVAEQLALVLTYAAWGFLMYAAVRASRWGWLIAMVVVMAITLAVPPTLIADSLVQLERLLFQLNEVVGIGLIVVFDQIGAVAVLVFALLLPMESPTTPTPPATPASTAE